MDDNQLGFGFAEPVRLFRTGPDPDEVREDMLAIIASARAVSAEAPWDAATLRHNRLIFPRLATWLPAEEAEQLCFAFAQEADRIEQLLAA